MNSSTCVHTTKHKQSWDKSISWNQNSLMGTRLINILGTVRFLRSCWCICSFTGGKSASWISSINTNIFTTYVVRTDDRHKCTIFLWYTTTIVFLWYTTTIVFLWYTTTIVLLWYTTTIVFLWYTTTIVFLWYTTTTIVFLWYTTTIVFLWYSGTCIYKRMYAIQIVMTSYCLV